MGKAAGVQKSRLVQVCPFYYGWVILGIGALSVVLTSPGQTYAISVFIDYFIEELGVSRSLVSTLYTAGTLTASFALPFVGRQIDRRGTRVMMVVVSLLLGLTCVYMGFIRNALMLGLGFFALRLLGQGSLSMVGKNVINQWWVRRRGLMMGITGMTSSLLGSGGFPNLINWLIPAFGWRASYMLLGGLLFGLMPLGWIFVRNRPEDYGLRPDGIVVVENESGIEQNALIEENWTVSEAMRTATFWVVSAGIASMSMLSTGLTFHFFSIFGDGGLSSTAIASVFLPIAATSAAVQFGGGILIDRIPIRIMLATALFLQAGILVMAPIVSTVETAVALGILMGIRGGLQLIVSSVVWAKFYGRRYLGSITGVASTLMVGSSALGPMPFGVARDLMGGYSEVLTGFSILPVILAFATLMYCKPPKRS